MSTLVMTGRSEDAPREGSALTEENLSAFACNEQDFTEKSCDTLPLGNADSTSPETPCHAQEALRISPSYLLSVSKGHFHGVQKGTGIGKHQHGRGIGKSCKLAHLEVGAIEHLGNARPMLTSPRLLRSPGRKKSPIRWFPRKKTESYLERKIRMLHVKEGNVASLDETLGAANLHLSRIEREKLAAQAAAAEAIAARKGALIEASWCRIIKLAGIPCNSAISELQNAEKKAAAALAEAENHGVNLQHGTVDPREPASEIVTATLETAFDVDKEVTAAIKAALKQLRQSSEISYDSQDEVHGEFLSLDDMASNTNEAVDSQSDTEAKGDANFEDHCMSRTGMDNSEDVLCSKSQNKSLKESKAKQSLITLMEKRIRELSDEHHTALAGIVATRGLSELLKDQSLEQELNGRTSGMLDSKPSNEQCSPKKGSDLGSILVKHVSRLQREVQSAKETNRYLQIEVEKRSSGHLQRPAAHVDSLDQILVKHVSKLEKEMLAAQAARRTPPKQNSKSVVIQDSLGLEDLLRRPHSQKEPYKEVKEGRQMLRGEEMENVSESSNDPFGTSDLGSVLIKHMSTIEKEKQAASELGTTMEVQDGKVDSVGLGNVGADSFSTPETTKGLNFTRVTSRDNVFGTPNEVMTFETGSKRTESRESDESSDLGSILVKHVSRLEKEKQMALALQDKSNTSERKAEKSKQSWEAGLEDVLVKRLSKLEVEKARLSGFGVSKTEGGSMEEFDSKENKCLDPMSKEDNLATGQSTNATWQSRKLKQIASTWSGQSLQDALSSTKSTSVQVSKDKSLQGIKPRRKSLREKQMEDAWGGLSLGNALKPHVSKLEKEQAAWKRAEEEARQKASFQR